MPTNLAWIALALSMTSLAACSAEAPAGESPAGEASRGEDDAVASTAEPLSAGISLAIDAAPGLLPTTWSYRELATRSFFGCKDYDILQGTGWFPATWYRTYTFASVGDRFTVNLQHTVRAALCAAQMDYVNFVSLEQSAPSLPDTKRVGHFAVVPDGTGTETTVTCKAETADAFTCDNAHVKLPNAGTMLVHVRWEE